MKIRMVPLILVPLLGLGLAACTVEKKEDGKLPEYDVKPAEVKIGTDTQRVVVPDVDITRPDSGDTTRKR